MPFLSKLGKFLGLSNPIKEIPEAIDRFVETADEKRAWQILKKKIEENNNKWQNSVNMVEAQHKSLFVAGWRPAIGWICSLGLLYSWFVHPILQMLNLSAPQLETGVIVSLVTSMLGMAGIRTYEKKNGIAKE